MHLLLTRPEPDSAPLAAQLARMGHSTLIAPLMIIEPVDAPPLALSGVQAILATSSNGVRALAGRAEFARARDIPLFAVGDATARAARAAGFSRVSSAQGDVHSLAEHARIHGDPAAGRLLHVAGHERAGDLKDMLQALGFTVETAVLYRAATVAQLPANALAGLRGGSLDGVLLYSPRSAHVYCALTIAAGVGAQAMLLEHYCLSDAVCQALGTHFATARVHVAGEPTQEAMLALLA